MGSEESGESPIHPVMLSPYLIRTKAVTNAEYVRFDPGLGGGRDSLPVVEVNWHQAYAYAAWLGGRLPTEAEWECACRAGTTSRWSFGDDESEIDRYGWTSTNAENRAHPGGELEPNPWGLYDMHGNVWEWVSDWQGEYSPELQVDPQGSPSSASCWRVVRGGCFFDVADDARSAVRDGDGPGNRFDNQGFRVVLPAPSEVSG